MCSLYRKLQSVIETMLPFYKGHTLCSASVMLNVITGEFPPVGVKVEFAIKCLKHSEAARSHPPDRGPLKQTAKWAIFRCDVSLLCRTGSTSAELLISDSSRNFFKQPDSGLLIRNCFAARVLSLRMLHNFLRDRRAPQAQSQREAPQAK